jgi:hypothetical protein
MSRFIIKIPPNLLGLDGARRRRQVITHRASIADRDGGMPMRDMASLAIHPDRDARKSWKMMPKYRFRRD